MLVTVYADDVGMGLHATCPPRAQKHMPSTIKSNAKFFLLKHWETTILKSIFNQSIIHQSINY